MNISSILTPDIVLLIKIMILSKFQNQCCTFDFEKEH